MKSIRLWQKLVLCSIIKLRLVWKLLAVIDLQNIIAKKSKIITVIKQNSLVLHFIMCLKDED